jgi:hypothetical protein
MADLMRIQLQATPIPLNEEKKRVEAKALGEEAQGHLADGSSEECYTDQSDVSQTQDDSESVCEYYDDIVMQKCSPPHSYVDVSPTLPRSGPPVLPKPPKLPKRKPKGGKFAMLKRPDLAKPKKLGEDKVFM